MFSHPAPSICIIPTLGPNVSTQDSYGAMSITRVSLKCIKRAYFWALFSLIGSFISTKHEKHNTIKRAFYASKRHGAKKLPIDCTTIVGSCDRALYRHLKEPAQKMALVVEGRGRGCTNPNTTFLGVAAVVEALSTVGKVIAS